ncbi:NmrA-like family protein [Diaporthe helianthi]|uniref:NmrA-like family protein n=1 Tax=Diaporthe helianthi TaxID=158607 RepID=A0A2P5HHM4_DIAHE|nr:NmrA-like family protein [Diaporthe helianthi]
MSSKEIKSVAVVGGTGTLGKPVVQELVAHGFRVTVLSRSEKQDELPNVELKAVDYDSFESLRQLWQQTVLDAAYASGVKRFIPSEFGINTRELQGLKIAQMLSGKIKLVDDLQKKAQENVDFTWTGLSNGLFFHYLGFDAKAKKAIIYDSGNEPFQTSSLELISKAVASILKHPRDTANKYLSIASFQPSLNEILQIVEHETGSKWSVERLDTKDLQKTGEKKLSNGDFSAFRELLRVHIHRDGDGHSVAEGKLANGLLELPQEDLRDSIRKWLGEVAT